MYSFLFRCKEIYMYIHYAYNEKTVDFPNDMYYVYDVCWRCPSAPKLFLKSHTLNWKVKLKRFCLRFLWTTLVYYVCACAIKFYLIAGFVLFFVSLWINISFLAFSRTEIEYLYNEHVSVKLKNLNLIIFFPMPNGQLNVHQFNPNQCHVNIYIWLETIRIKGL